MVAHSPAEYTIEAIDLHKTYPGGVQALRGISFAARSGEVLALLGPNGAGKSTAVRILTTLSAPTRGNARVAGFDVATEALQVRRRIGYVAQISGVDPLATGRENLRLQGRIFRIPSAHLTARMDHLLSLFRLEEAADRLVRTYSGGMKRRLDVAMGLVHQPEVLFLDEPTTGLDPESRTVMWKEVRRLAAAGLTILLTTHYLEEADQLAQQLAIVDQGKVVVAGSPEELKGKLRCDSITLELTNPQDLPSAMALTEQIPGVEKVLLDGDEIYAQVSHGAKAVPTFVAVLEKAGFEVAQISLSRPSLDDVYLTATGHTFDHKGQTAKVGF